MTEEAHRAITTIKQMNISLNGSKDQQYEDEDQELRITIPLISCLQELKEKHSQISRIHKERFEQVKSRQLTRDIDSVLTFFRARAGSRILFLTS